MQRGDENAAPINSKRSDKNVVSQLRAQFEVKTPRTETAPSVNRTSKKADGTKTPRASPSCSVEEFTATKKNVLKIDADRTSMGGEEHVFLTVTPSTPGPVSPSRLPFKRLHTDKLANFCEDPKLVPSSSQQGVKKAKLKSLGEKKESDGVITVLRFRGPDKLVEDRSAYVEDGVVVMKSADKKDCTRFAFDEVCAEDVTQEEMFERAARRMTEEFLDGFNATIFAYGQTGSGKTHTMLGDVNLYSPQRGITPRVFSHVFTELQARQEAEGPFEVKLSFLQIYNEKCQDLLTTTTTNKIGHVEEDLKIREKFGMVCVEGLSQFVCKSAEQALEYVAAGTQNRKVGKTAMNTVSSRSHSILTLELKTGKNFVSRLNLIDLAGSENQRTSASSNAAQQNEANNINTSLHFLGKCLREAVKGGVTGHVNYRNSKLTKLLKDSLAGTAKTCVIATVSALPAFAPETLSTLKFAAAIKLIQVQAVKHPVKGGQGALESEIAHLKLLLKTQEAEAQEKYESLAADYDKLKVVANKSVFDISTPTNNSSSSNHGENHDSEVKIRYLEVEVAELIQSRDDFASRLTMKEQELARVQGQTGLEEKYTAQVQEMANTYDSLQRQLSSKASAQTLEFEHANQALQSSQRVIEELQLSLLTSQTEAIKLREELAETGKLRVELAEVQEDLRFMIEKEAAQQAKTAHLEKDLETRLSKCGVQLSYSSVEGGAEERTDDMTIRRLAATTKESVTATETIHALQQEVLRLQMNSQKDMNDKEELRAQLHALQEPKAVGEDNSAQLKQLQSEVDALTTQLATQRKSCQQHSLELTTYRSTKKANKTHREEAEKLKTENKDLIRQIQHLSQQLNQERNDQEDLCRFARTTEGEKHRALLEKIEADFGGKLPLGNQARLFIRSGLLKRVSKKSKMLEYNFFLFTDVLIYASASKSHSQGKYKAHRVIHLGLCRLVDIQPRPDSEANTLYSNSFRLITPQKSDMEEPRKRGFYISCDTPAEKQSWMTAIGSQIEKIYSQPEGTVVQVPRVADVSAPERVLDGDIDGPSMNARSSFSVCEDDRKDIMRSRESSLDFSEELKGEILNDEAGSLSWAIDDPNRPRATSNESVVSRSRAGSVSSSVFSRMTEFTAADLPTSHTSLMRARVQAHDYCRLCVRPFSSTALKYSRQKAVCGCCDDKNICRGCCSSKAVPPRSSDGKERKVCLACHGGITRLVGRGIPRLSVEYE